MLHPVSIRTGIDPRKFMIRPNGQEGGRMRSVELFTGCGGLGLGLSRAGFVHELLVEWDRDAVETVLHNKHRGIEHIAHWPMQHADVRNVEWTQFRGASLVAGGPPCQPFSIGGKHLGNVDHRDMWPQAIRAVSEVRPRAFMFENVRGLARPKFAHYLAAIVESLSEPMPGLRYNVRVEKVNAADFGAPQKRHRVVICGVAKSEGVAVPSLLPTHSRQRMLWDQFVTGTYWDEHGLKRKIDGFSLKDEGIVAILRSAKIEPDAARWVTVRDALRELGEPDGRANHFYQPGARVYKGHTGSPLDEPAKALKAGDHGVPGGENMMVRDDQSVRYFTLREAARLQGLPDDYEFPRSWSESMRQLGNAMPCQLAKAAGSTLAEALTGSADAVPIAA